MKILALSMYTDNGFIEGMMHAGARGYIAKDSEPEELYKAIRKAAGPAIPDRRRTIERPFHPFWITA